MDDDCASAGTERKRITGAASSTNAARHIARERQKRELRRERDAIVLAIARDLGEQGLAERLGVAQPVVDKLLADARDRLGAGVPAPQEAEMSVRRQTRDRERWAEADAHYEALGSGPAVSDRRSKSSRSSTPAR
jgi:hypothetical protein